MEINKAMVFDILCLEERPDLKERAAQWFHEKWGIPLEAYMESMAECLEKRGAVPQWYLAMEGGQIIGGLGVTPKRENSAPGLHA